MKALPWYLCTILHSANVRVIGVPAIGSMIHRLGYHACGKQPQNSVIGAVVLINGKPTSCFSFPSELSKSRGVIWAFADAIKTLLANHMAVETAPVAEPSEDWPLGGQDHRVDLPTMSERITDDDW